MPLTPDEKKDLKSLIDASRKTEISFGFCFGKKPDRAVFQMHRTRSADVLMKSAKKAGETAKVLWGTVNTQGKVLAMTCLDSPPSGSARHAKNFLQSADLKFKVAILDADGNVLEEDGEDDTGDAQPNAAEAKSDQVAPDGGKPTEAADPAEAKWKKARAQFLPHMEPGRVEKRSDPDKIKKIWQVSEESASSKDFEKALKALMALKPLLQTPGAADTPSQSEADPALAKKWSDTSAKLDPLVQKAVASQAPNHETIAKAWAGAKSKAEAQDYKNALGIAAKLTPALKKIAADGQSSGQDPMAIWRKAKETVDVSISALQKAIKAHENPDLQRIAEFGLNGATDGNQVAIQKALMEFNMAEGATRTDAGKKLIAQTAVYRKFVSESPVIKLCERNPFGVKVSIKSPILTALDQIDQAAAA